MQQHELELQADRIEMVLRDHKAPGRVTGGNVTPRWIQFLLQTAPGIKMNRVESLSREIAMALGAPNARVVTQGGAVRVEVPRSDPQPVKLVPLYSRLPQIPFGTAMLGLADDGAPLLLRLPSPDVAHVLVAGTTGSGKTALVQSMIVSLALCHRRSQLQFVLIDPKSRAFEGLKTLPHLLTPIVSQADRAIATLIEMVALMEARDRSHVTDPRVVIVIDELADLVQTSGSEVIDRLGRLVQRGREAGIHVIGATQKPSSAILGPLVKANFPVRLVGRVVSSEDARVAAGIGGTGAERLTGHGDFVAVSASGVTRFQAAYISRAEIIDVAVQLNNIKRRDEIAQTGFGPTSAEDREESHALRSALRVLRRVK
jgi:S-DNA-T family DNA segregation ATPase FtsK/SpoIIIE